MARAVLIPDADVLIVLAQHPENLAAIAAIKKAIKRHDPWGELVIAECVKDAYEREKERAAQSYWATQRAAIKALRKLGVAISDEKAIKAVADDLTKKVSKLEGSMPVTMAAVDELIGLGRIVPSTTPMWAEAARRFRNDVRPAGERSQKSCITDCVLWQVVLGESKKAPVTFCTNNKRDFSAPDHDEKLHPSLAEELGKAKHCYHSLEGFQKHHLKKIEVVLGPVFDPAEKCFHCGANTEPGLIPRPSGFGGWSYQKFCQKCHRYSDTGEPYDD